ncbi:MAG: OPT/YSL family transporter [Candidatus Odinarchaeota archaeon]|nr:OPT/YSL family transporter [Candidatus Odinarchaeota archaeon]
MEKTEEQETTMDKDNRILTKRVIVFGLVLGTLFNFLGIYLSYKIGIAAIGGIFILGYILLKLTGEYNYKENATMMMIIGSMSLPTFGVTANMAALVVFRDYLTYPVSLSIPLIMVTSFVGTILGVILLYPLRKQFLALRWPMVLPTATIVKVIGEKGGYLKKALYGLFSAMAVTIATFATNLRTLKLKNMPTFIGFEVSPLMFALGFFVSFAGSFLLLIGSIYGVLVWYFLEGAASDISISAHIMNPAIFSVAIPMMVTTAIYSIYENKHVFRETLHNLKRNGNNKEGFIPDWVAFATLPLLPVLAFGGLLLVPDLVLSDILDIEKIIILALPIVFISAIFLARARGEAGFSVSFTVDVVLILAAVLILPTLEDMLIAFAILGSYESASLVFLNYMKFGQLTDVPEKTVFKAIIIGIFPGVIITALSIWAFQYLLGGLGTDAFPAPNAYATGGYILGIIEAIGKGVIPPIYNPYLVIVSVVLTIVLLQTFKRFKLKGFTPIILAIGMLIPPSYAFPVFLGGLYDLYLKWKNRASKELAQKEYENALVVLSGVASGEGIVLLLMTLATVVLLIL